MPRFEHDSVGIAPWIAQTESKLCRVLSQPAVRFGGFERLSQRRTSWRANVNGPAGMMFAESGQCARRQNLLDGLAGRQLPGNDLTLVIETPKSGNDCERHAVARCGFAHCLPS